MTEKEKNEVIFMECLDSEALECEIDSRSKFFGFLVADVAKRLHFPQKEAFEIVSQKYGTTE